MRLRQRVSSKWLAGTAACVALAFPMTVQAQAPVVSRPVVQALPSADQKALNGALARLGRNPRDTAALLEAGDSARKLGDFDAAIGFYRRADEIAPGNGRVKAGLAASLAQSGDPVAALPLFAEAERAGATPALIAADRGLAYDLVGDNATAQRYYAMVLGTAADDEVRMRLAISQAIAGDAKTSEATIMPLLRKQDKPGWRTRAFALAIAGDTKQAVEVSDTILPPQLAQNIAPYLRYMPRLTPAQQAAAANLGKFPRASEIGRDDARIAAYAPTTRVATADANLVPRGEALGGGKASSKSPRTTRTASGTARTTSVAVADSNRAAVSRAGSAHVPVPANPSREQVRVAPPEPKPTIERNETAAGELPPVRPKTEVPAALAATSASKAPGSVSSQPAPAAPLAAASPSVPETTRPAAAQVAAASPGFDLARVPGQQTAVTPAASSPAVRPATPEAPPVPSAQQLSLEQIFADLGKPTMQIVPTSGAVDIRQIEPARPAPPRIELPKPEPDSKAADKPATKTDPKAAAKVDPKLDPKTAKADAKSSAKAAKAEPAKPKKPLPPAHPSRIWVQVGVGRDKDAIAFDWRRSLKQAPALLKGRQPYISDMGRTNRILVGPFETQKAAGTFIAEARKQGFSDALPWTSPAGQVVDALSVK